MIDYLQMEIDSCVMVTVVGSKEVPSVVVL